jgi:hypothetical protein
VRTDPDPVEVIRQTAKAERVIFAETAPERISENADFYKCRWCSFWSLCHGGRAMPAVNCRTCLHVTPTSAGGWHCARWDRVLSVDEQRRGCQAHLFNPSMIAGEVTDASEEGEWVSYRLLKDGSVWRDGATTTN